jgi:hypothetical protein
VAGQGRPAAASTAAPARRVLPVGADRPDDPRQGPDPESFFATYKKELIHIRPWNGLTEVRQHTFLWIERYYNRRRRHSTLNYLTPHEYELGYRKLTDLAV